MAFKIKKKTHTTEDKKGKDKIKCEITNDDLQYF